MSDILVKVDNVSKRFCRSLKRSLWYGVQDLGSELGGLRSGLGSGLPQTSASVSLRKDEFWAVKDVSFEIRRGECLGLIGRNGAGKTTLLRLLNGLIKPDSGRIEMHGQVGALIALGAGFNPILTGRENILVNAGILGISEKQILKNLDRIIDFAEIEEFIDSPVSTYSSGMQVRLGFAIASTFEPEILLIDEVLAVGDVSFKLKCISRISELLDRCAIIFVSHSIPQISAVCSIGLYMKNGVMKSGGVSKTNDAISDYLADQSKNLSLPPIIEKNNDIKSFTSLMEHLGRRKLRCTIRLTAHKSFEEVYARTTFVTPDGTHVAHAITNLQAIRAGEESKSIIELDAFNLLPQPYSFFQTIYSSNTLLAKIVNMPSLLLSAEGFDSRAYAPFFVTSRLKTP